MSPREHAGWYLVAFADTLIDDITAVRIGDRRLMLVADARDTPAAADGQSTNGGDGGHGVRLYDAACPHRGASLAHGGVRCGSAIRCPFHGRLIGLDGRGPMAVASYPTAVVGGLVLASLDRSAGGAALTSLEGLLEGLTLVPAVDALVEVPIDYVVENAFDAAHFSVVHGVPRVEAGDTRLDPAGFLVTTNRFVTVHDPWTDERTRDRLRLVLGPTAQEAAHTVSTFRATAYSPTLVATQFGSPREATVIVTGALPTPEGTRVRVAVAGRPGVALDRAVAGAVTAIDQDIPIWRHIDLSAPTRLDRTDAAVMDFQEFCRGYAAAPSRAAAWEVPTHA